MDWLGLQWGEREREREALGYTDVRRAWFSL